MKEIIPMKIIDFHAHPYLTANEFFGFYPEEFNPSPEQAKTDLELAGINHICGSVIRPCRYKPDDGFAYFKDLNQRALSLKKELGDFYTPGIHVHPDYVRQSCEEIALYAGQGVRLVGELVPYMHCWNDYSNQSFSEILDTAESYHMAVNYHTMLDEQEEMEKMVAAHPNITFIAAHPGEREYYEHHLERMKKYPNLYLDLSGTGLFRYGMLAYGVHKIGAERFLFGTDYPICNPRMYVQAVLQEKLTDSELELIFHKNAERILGIH